VIQWCVCDFYSFKTSTPKTGSKLFSFWRPHPV
jgi:hypothetical protein